MEDTINDLKHVGTYVINFFVLVNVWFDHIISRRNLVLHKLLTSPHLGTLPSQSLMGDLATCSRGEGAH